MKHNEAIIGCQLSLLSLRLKKYPEYVVNKHTACGINILFNDHKVLTFIELRMSGSLFTDPSFILTEDKIPFTQ